MSMALPLPRMIQEEILARLPIPSLMEARRVCKLWNRITKTRRFTKWHSTKHTGGFHMLFVSPGRFTVGALVGARVKSPLPWRLYYNKAIVGRNNPNEGPSKEVERLVATSGGLLLFFSLDRGYFVVNPVLNVERVLPPMPVKPAAFLATYCAIDVRDEGDSYKVVIAGFVESDERNGEKITRDFVAVGRITGYFQTFVAVYDSSTGKWTSSKSKGPGLEEFVTMGMGLANIGGKFAINRANQHLVLHDTFYCIPRSTSRIYCFDIKQKMWQPEWIKPPTGSEFVALVNYNGELAALLRTPPTDHDDMEAKCSLSLNVYKGAGRWELVEQIPDSLIPPKNVALDAWAFDDYVVLQLCMSGQPGGVVFDNQSATLFKLYNRKTKEAMVYPDELMLGLKSCPFGMFVTECAILLRLTLKPNIHSRP